MQHSFEIAPTVANGHHPQLIAERDSPMSFEFRPRLITQCEGSKRPVDLPPRWFRSAVGAVVDRDGVAWFIPSQSHPALRDFGPRMLGAADNQDDKMMTEAEKVFREA